MLSSFWMLCGAVAFATMGACASAAGKNDVPWQVVALARALGPFVVVGLMCAVSRVRIVLFAPFPLWVRSICGSISLLSTFYAFTRLPVGDVLTITNLYPLWVALLSWPLLGSAPAREVWPALGLGLFGIIMIQQPHFAEGNYATFAALLASLVSSLAMIGLHRIKGIGTRSIVFHFSIVSMLACIGVLALSGLLNRGLWDIPNGAWGPLFGVAISATFGQFFLTLAFTQGHPARVSVVGLSQAGFGLFYDVIIWGRTLDAVTIVGMLMVLLPSAWMIWRVEEGGQSTVIPETPAEEIKVAVADASPDAVPPLSCFNGENTK